MAREVGIDDTCAVTAPVVLSRVILLKAIVDEDLQSKTVRQVPTAIRESNIG